MNRDTYVIIPVYNEDTIIMPVLRKLKKSFDNIICVNDGSSDNSEKRIRESAVTLINHPLNLGQGAAIQTGIDYALQDQQARYFITFDADGQHQVNDALRLLNRLKRNKSPVDIVMGSRFLGQADNISSAKRLVLKCAVLFSNATTGLKLTDAHNGLRAFNRKFASALNLTMPDMAHATEIIHRVSEGRYKYVEIPVTIKYTKYSKAKGQSLVNAVNIGFDLMIGRWHK